ncbi:hypothetical protein KFL_000330080 [Klebsormidium nitens]|uniref:Uncharacterized protein n=1 Tax=Klebsormidium nitens TaxID=105231 RepID=A0A1Y1HP52_KLENI|nr:hypothetical protein KFL_000330080 [Klebsormidium nitens]|eukprot:GAQ79562.1 hypothetical protein KFL_000330080 [Klebsormidium nitens]
MSGSRSMALLGRRLLAPRAVVPVRGGAGQPIGSAPPPSSPLPESDELTWDDGSATPEPCLDIVAPTLTKYEALAYLSLGLSGFAALLGVAWYKDKASTIPYTPREYPYDNLRVELGKEPAS